ncbi:MAG: DEAD/DEAH box helicase [Pirellulaceae bacterium]|nr:DEAD/DEAH box helicase [Pirellulaceae bacterium]
MPLLHALATEGYEKPTAIQQLAIPIVLDGTDVMGCAQTGTGKTAAFALPTLQRLAQNRNPEQPAIRGLVLAPTRELAAQIGQNFVAYGKYLKLRVAVIHGGVSQVPQVRAIGRGVDLLVATPGRLLDLMNQRQVDISKVQMLIIDEADQMFDMGFLRDLKRIVSSVPQKQRQTLMFSATMPEPIRDLAKQWLSHPKYVKVAKVSSASGQVEQSVFHVSTQNKPKLLANYLKDSVPARSIVFTRTKHGADNLVKMLLRAGIDAVAIHGNKSQNARTRNMERFKSERPPVLIATDIAARGIDVDGVSHVINYHMPEVPEIYIHRIGRTGRADATGVAVSFCSPEERGDLRGIERLLDANIQVNQSFAVWTNSAQDSDEPANKGLSVSAGRSKYSNQRSSQGGKGARRLKDLPTTVEPKRKKPRKPSCFALVVGEHESLDKAERQLLSGCIFP